jgi:DNA-binding NtrC family response regulator
MHDEALVLRETRASPRHEPDPGALGPRRQTPDPLEHATGLLGASSALSRVRATLTSYAPTSATVLIQGETGTGKELAARAIHLLSPRAKRAFVAANVAAVPPSLILSELFGHERGAFTGAHLRHRGLFEQAAHGTLFLDEIGELGVEAQAALLRVLETRAVRAVGAEREHVVDVRLVVATHRNLALMVQQGLFREDLYFRLNTLVLRLPPLRHRAGDIRELVPYLLGRLGADASAKHLDPSALRALLDYGWPGNVRQLANVLHRVAVQSIGLRVSADDVRRALEDEPRARREILDGARALEVQELLRIERGSISASARRLGIARSTLRAYVRRFHIVHVRG